MRLVCVSQRLLPLVAAAWLVAHGPAWALYKVVGPDGKVTYTDRPPVSDSAAGASTSTVRSSSGPDVSRLPLAVRQAAQRFPVQLFTSTGCEPCESARLYLTRRGVPFAELTVESAEQQQAMRQSFKVDGLPLLRVGGKNMAGYNEREWGAYLDAAGYPATNQLPTSYRPPAARPWGQPSQRTSTEGESRSVAPAPGPTTPPVTPPPGIRF